MIAAISARSLIATLGLLTLATSASAECAWVLWVQAAGSGGTILAVPLGSWQERDRCEQDRVSRAGSSTAGARKVRLPPRHRGPARAEREVSRRRA